MHLKCVQAGFYIPRDTVYELKKLLDPEGMNARLHKRLKRRSCSSPGPNFVWHIDGYDKLKPYGIAISGCIDGFSRNILWLEAGTSNNDPKVIANYFIKTVKNKGGCPKRVRTDLGTENVHIECMQKFLRQDGEDSLADLSRDGNDHLSGNTLDKCIIQYSFMSIVQVCSSKLGRNTGYLEHTQVAVQR
uniref:Uncharacterized protein LOC111116138 n=1 Tax=Crassostrea virginica TaxID=6565 RepID=A0A8B8C6V1_CRAVI|nr:uncharacterized protein LOC111116138 [Crassostrea virginica]